jgi:hypothetical protein
VNLGYEEIITDHGVPVARWTIADIFVVDEKPTFVSDGYPTRQHVRQHVWGLGIQFFPRTPPEGQKWRYRFWTDGDSSPEPTGPPTVTVYHAGEESSVNLSDSLRYRLLWFVNFEDNVAWNDEIVDLTEHELSRGIIDTVPA